MKLGMILLLQKVLEALAKSIRILGGNHATLEVHKDDDTHGIIRVCCTKESGWIDLEKGFYD